MKNQELNFVKTQIESVAGYHFPIGQLKQDLEKHNMTNYFLFLDESLTDAEFFKQVLILSVFFQKERGET